jgi:hypothetical protein
MAIFSTLTRSISRRMGTATITIGFQLLQFRICCLQSHLLPQNELAQDRRAGDGTGNSKQATDGLVRITITRTLADVKLHILGRMEPTADNEIAVEAFDIGLFITPTCYQGQLT